MRADAVNKLIGENGNKRGKDAERQLEKALQTDENSPEWILGVRLSTKREDGKKKADVVVMTDVGKIYIQIKNSYIAYREFLEEKAVTPYLKYHVALHIPPGIWTNSELGIIRRRAYKALRAVRKELLELRS